MAKGILLLTVTGVLAMFLVCSATLKIRSCTNSILDVLEPGPHEIYCDGVGTDGPINWTITSMGETEQDVAYCASAFACETFLIESFDAQPMSTTTTATLSIKANHRSWAGATLKCVAQNDEVASCKLRVIKPAKVTRCTTSTNVTTLRSTGYCRAENMFTSDGRYTCSLQELSPNGRTRPLYGSFPTLEPCGDGDICASCEFSFDVTPQEDGNYTYFVSVIPGPQNAYAMTIEIQRPADPSVQHCTAYVMEHRNLMCFCIWNNERPGKPPPIITWPTVSTSPILRINNISRAENGHIYTCRQQWGSDVKNVQYHLQVAYGPKTATILGPEYHITNGSMPLTLKCNTDDVNPESVCTWSGALGTQSSDGNTCTFTPTVTEAIINVTCTAKNTVFDTLVATATKVIDIKSDDGAKVTSLTLNGVAENLTVDGFDNISVILNCATSGRPKPSIRVVRVDTGQPLEVDTSHASSQDENVQQHTLTTSARCQDGAVYRCEASNTVGTTQENVTLFVNCAPTLTEELQHLTDGSTVLFITSEKAIDVVGYPPPVPHVTFFGDTNPFTEEAGLGKATRDVLVLCKPSGHIYMTHCTISDEESTTANSGFYTVTFVNTFGEVSVSVYLDASSQKDGSVTGSGGTQSFPVAAVAGGVAASVLAIIVVIVIVLVIRRKCYRTYDRPNHRRDQDTNPYTGLRPTGAAANGNSGDVNTEGVYEEINPEQRQHPSTETHLHKSPGEGTEFHDYTNTTSVPRPKHSTAI